MKKSLILLHSGDYITYHVTGSTCIAHAKIRDVYKFQYVGVKKLEHVCEPDKHGHTKGKDPKQFI